MVITNFGKERIALRIGSNVPIPIDFAIGEGSGTALVTDVTLESEVDKQNFTVVNMSGAQTIMFQGDWNSVELSGIQLAEWGVVDNSAPLTGSIWSRQALPPLTFDGTNELRIEETWTVY